MGYSRALHMQKLGAEGARAALAGTGNGKSYPKLNGHAHRVIVEHKLGRPLAPGETVHHEDENKQNYQPTNLVVFPSQSAHMRIGHGRKDRAL